MFIRELVISGLRKQHVLLEELIDHLEGKSKLDSDDHYLYGEMTGKVAKNLKTLRKIKGRYVSFLEKEERDISQKLFENCMIRSGISPKSHLPANHVGLYTDFT